MQQLIFPFEFQRTTYFHNFIGAKNQQIIINLCNLIKQDNKQNIYISGVLGSGRTHLLKACYNRARAYFLKAIYFDCKTDKINKISPSYFSKYHLLIIDNIHLASHKMQYSLCALYNLEKSGLLNLIISGDTIPNRLNLSLADLKTRLSLSLVFCLEYLNYTQKKEVLKQKMTMQNLHIEDDIYDYLLTYYSRNLHALVNLLESLIRHHIKNEKAMNIVSVKEFIKSNIS